MIGDKKFVIRCRGIIFHEGKLLLVRHHRDASFVALPGGHLEWGEDPKECIEREIFEELGVRPSVGNLEYVYAYMSEDVIQYIEFFFEIKNGKDYVDLEGKERSHAFEIVEIIWANPSDNIRILPEQIGRDFKGGKIISNEVRYIKN